MFRERIVRIAAAEIGKVRDANAGAMQKVGADRLVKYYQEAWQREYRSWWERDLRRVGGKVHGWTGIFALWTIVAAGRDDISWGIQKLGGGPKGLGSMRSDLANMRPGDIIVFANTNVHAVLERVAGDSITFIQGDAYHNGTEQNVARRTWSLRQHRLWGYYRATSGLRCAPARVAVVELRASPSTGRAGSQIQLDGTASRVERTDPRCAKSRGQLPEYSWTLTQRPRGSKARLSATGTLRPSFKTDRSGAYRIRLAACGTGCGEGIVATSKEIVVQASPQDTPGGGAPGWMRRLTAQGGGFADLHAHHFGNLGFGGKWIFGKPYHPEAGKDTKGGMKQALRHCTENHGAGGSLDLTGEHFHGVDGYPEFAGWPKWSSMTHQQMYYDWLKRAHDAGLRLMVMTAVNNESICKLVTLLGGFSCHDMDAVDAQIEAAKLFQAYVDRISGGLGKGWYRIAYTAAEAEKYIKQGKLAVVLGVEVDALFNCVHPAPPPSDRSSRRGKKRPAGDPKRKCLQGDVRSRLAQVHALGVRQITPIHLADNQFGAAALYSEDFAINNKALTGNYHLLEDPRVCAADQIDFRFGYTKTPRFFALFKGYAPIYPRGPHCNAGTLSSLGEFLIQQMMGKGMIVDTEHMSTYTFRRTFEIAKQHGYPLVSSHSGMRSLGYSYDEAKVAVDDETRVAMTRSEAMRSIFDLVRLGSLRGMVAPILSPTPTKKYRTGPVNDCAGSSKSWAQSYLYTLTTMQGKGSVALGSDFNGGLAHVAPRFGKDACPKKESAIRNVEMTAQRRPVQYLTPLRDCRKYRLSDLQVAVCLANSNQACQRALDADHGGRFPSGSATNRVDVCLGFRKDYEKKYPGCAEPTKHLGSAYRRAACMARRGRCGAVRDREERAICEAVTRSMHWVRGVGEALPRSTAGRREFDYNVDGMAHYGMIMDFLQDLKNIGVSERKLAPLFGSALAYVKMWRRAEQIGRRLGGGRPAASPRSSGTLRLRKLRPRTLRLRKLRPRTLRSRTLRSRTLRLRKLRLRKLRLRKLRPRSRTRRPARRSRRR